MRKLLGHADVVLGQLLADVPGTGVEHEPDLTLITYAHFCEVVARSKCPNLLFCTISTEFDRFGDPIEPPPEAIPPSRSETMQPPRLDGTVMHPPPHRNRLLDLRPQPGQIPRQIVRRQRRLHRGHSAADVHAHRRRAHRALHGDHGPDRRALAVMDVRHHREALDPRQGRDVAQLLQGHVLDRRRVGPHTDRDLGARHLHVRHIVLIPPENKQKS
ncbi:UNVERIFIED_CONTAM: hypothetical protein RKD50_005395 [Streptomyces canus]